MKRTEMPDTIKTTEESAYNGDAPLTVYIFGAGASVTAGYPTAAKFAGKLEQFLIRLSARPPEFKVDRLKKTISSTLEHLYQTGAQTIDELVGTLNDTEAVENAKTATEALFLDIEHQLNPQMLRDYSNFLIRACLSPGNSKVADRLRPDVRVLTFNYDRALEIAFAYLSEDVFSNNRIPHTDQHKSLKYSLKTHYHALNTGFHTGRGYELKKGCFAYLKLHGSVGLKVPSSDPDIKHQQPFPVVTVLDDQKLWRENGEMKVPSLIVFPHEKAGLPESSSDRLPTFHDYIAKIESDAVAVIQAAKEVHICGYSVCQPNWSRFEKIVSLAPTNCRFVIHDISQVSGYKCHNSSWLETKG
ncbi:MAG: hypothetical protein ACOYM3_27230, partial [Terrimicrobiaceae bacterium]